MRSIHSFVPLAAIVLVQACGSHQTRPEGPVPASRAEQAAAGRQMRVALDSVRGVIHYDASTGTLQNVPLIAGRRYQIVLDGLNPVCYRYSADVYIRQENPDLTKLVAQFGSLPASGTAPPPKALADTAAAGGPKAVEGVQRITGTEEVGAALARARENVRAASRTLAELRQSVQTVESVSDEVITTACTTNPTFASLHAKWEQTQQQRDDVLAGSRSIEAARARLDAARQDLQPVDGGDEEDRILRLVEVTDTLATNLESKLPAAISRMLLSQGAIDAALAQPPVSHAIFLPANADSVGLTVTVTPVYTAAGTTPAKQVVSLPVRHGMRIFLSVGALGSALNSHDFARVNRPCIPAVPSCTDTYSTYADRTGNRGFAFSPVVQGNVAFRDVLSSGVSLHTSVGVAARTVNGSASPEFFVGAGTGFVDRLLFTVGFHYARDERLQLGRPSEVARTAVPTTVTDADAISTVWRGAFGATVTVRLPGN